MRPSSEIPDDPTLPAIPVIRSSGLAAALPDLEITGPVALRLCGYTSGSRATFDARAGSRRFAVKCYAEDPAPEVGLYIALMSVGMAGDSGARVPRLLGWEPELRVLAISWLDGAPANEVLQRGQGRRAGELAATFLRRLARVPAGFAPPVWVADVVDRMEQWVAELAVADRELGRRSGNLCAFLRSVCPANDHARLVHGTFYARHILDLGDGPGAIDWQGFGRGPIELDAGMFLATISRNALRHEATATEAVCAKEAFLAGLRDLVNPQSLAWHWATALIDLAARGLKRQPPAEARVLLDEAARLAEGASPDLRGSVGGALQHERVADIATQSIATRVPAPDALYQENTT